MMFAAARHEKNAAFRHFVNPFVCLELPMSMLVIKQLVMRVRVRLREIDETRVLIELHAQQMQNRIAETIVDPRAENVLPAFGNQPVRIERTWNQCGIVQSFDAENIRLSRAKNPVAIGAHRTISTGRSARLRISEVTSPRTYVRNRSLVCAEPVTTRS